MHTVTRFAISFIAATTLFATFASADPALDNAGKCRDNGKFVKQSMCEKPAAKCRNVTTKKFAKCDAPNTEPVPTPSDKKAK
jgi:hypothetical protein